MPQADKVIDTDVLVVGGGLAGCWAAIRARELTPKVTLADKSKVAKSGASTFTNQTLAPTPAGDLMLWLRELVEAGDYLNDQEWVEAVLRENGDRVADMVRWGVPFERDEKGNLLARRGRAHINTRVILCNGHKMMARLRARAQELGVNVVDRMAIVDLLTSDGRCPTGGSVVGAVGLDTRSGELTVFRAKAVILASGQIGSKIRAHFVNNLSGDGHAMAYRAGAEVVNMEFCTTGNISHFERKYHSGSQALLVGMGAQFVNAQGERFMARYDARLMERTKLSTQCQAFVKEAMEGRGPIFWDMRSFTADDVTLIRKLLPTTLRPFDEGGIDIRKQLIECTPVMQVASACGEGGTRINIRCETNIPGLYAVGSASRNPVQGTYTVGGVNLAFCNVSGFRGGENAARWVQAISWPELVSRQVTGLEKEILSPLHRQDGISPDEVIKDIHNITIPAYSSVFKSEERVRAVLDKLERLEREKLDRMAATDAHELLKVQEAKNILLLCRLVFTAALERKESRSWHFREEFPYRDDVDWLKWVVLRRGKDNAIETRIEPIPFEKYPVKPFAARMPHPLAQTTG